MPKSKPIQLIIRAYQVGFGDCFLLSFRYPGEAGAMDDRHVLIDCGSAGKPKNAASLDQVAAQIREDCGGQLTAIIATHRHSDHINGFATHANGKGPGDILKSLQPKLVIQPWTEDPDLPPTATSPRPNGRKPSLGQTKSLFAAELDGMNLVAEGIQKELRHINHLSPAVVRQLEFLGSASVRNPSAVKNLIAMGQAGRAEFLSYGDSTSLEDHLPGVKVHVLGPPTPEQHAEVTKQRSREPNEYWHILGLTGSRLAATGKSPFADAQRLESGEFPPSARWLVRRIRAIHGDQRLSIVRALDEVLNNTSLILLFEVDGKKLLFPGDAQIENWSYALKHAPNAAKNRQLLAQTDVYKVGHHGSLNATPKSLWKLFRKRNKKTGGQRMITVVSTMRGLHGSSPKTEVPRRTLVAALQSETDYQTTQSLRKHAPTVECIRIDL